MNEREYFQILANDPPTDPTPDPPPTSGQLQDAEAIKKLIHEIRATVADNKTNSAEINAKLDKMAKDASLQAENLQKAQIALKEDKKQIAALEATISRMGTSLKSKKDDGSISNPVYIEAFNRAVETGRILEKVNPELVQAELKASIIYKNPTISEDRLKRTMLLAMQSTGSGPDGGFLTQLPADQFIAIEKREWETEPMRQICTVRTTAKDKASILLRDTRPESGWGHQYQQYNIVDDHTETAKIAVVEIPVNKMEAFPAITEEMADDPAYNLDTDLVEQIADEFMFQSNWAYLVGDGAKFPKGILTYENWANPEQYERRKIAAYETETALTLHYNDFVNISAGLISPYRPNAVWFGHRLTWAEILKLVDNEDRPLLSPQLLFTGITPQVLGQRYIFAEDMPRPVPGQSPSPWSNNQKALLYGDFSGYYIIDKAVGMKVTENNNTFAPGFIKWYIRKWTGGGIGNFGKIKLLKIKSAAP